MMAETDHADTTDHEDGRVSRSKLFVGNLPFSMENVELSEVFSEFGEVKGAKIRRDRRTKKSRGFAFVTMADEGQAEKAKLALHEKEFQGRRLTVKSALPRRSAAENSSNEAGPTSQATENASPASSAKGLKRGRSAKQNEAEESKAKGRENRENEDSLKLRKTDDTQAGQKRKSRKSRKK